MLKNESRKEFTNLNNYLFQKDEKFIRFSDYTWIEWKLFWELYNEIEIIKYLIKDVFNDYMLLYNGKKDDNYSEKIIIKLIKKNKKIDLDTDNEDKMFVIEKIIDYMIEILNENKNKKEYFNKKIKDSYFIIKRIWIKDYDSLLTKLKQAKIKLIIHKKVFFYIIFFNLLWNLIVSYNYILKNAKLLDKLWEEVNLEELKNVWKELDKTIHKVFEENWIINFYWAIWELKFLKWSYEFFTLWKKWKLLEKRKEYEEKLINFLFENCWFNYNTMILKIIYIFVKKFRDSVFNFTENEDAKVKFDILLNNLWELIKYPSSDYDVPHEAYKEKIKLVFNLLADLYPTITG